MGRYYMFHKPRGCVTACSDAVHRTVMDYFPRDIREGLFPMGRLDIDTEGFLIMTDDGELCYRLMRPEFHVEKEYYFYAFGRISDESREMLESGIVLDRNGTVTKPAKLRTEKTLTVREIESFLPGNRKDSYMKNPTGIITEGYITITEGKNHQVKRMLKAAGCKIAYLKRVRIGGISLDDSLEKGKYRPLTEEEIILLKGSN